MYKNTSFVHLHTHSIFSISESTLKISEMIKTCKKFQMPAVALTDRNNLFGALEFSLSCAKEGIQPIIGCDMSLMLQNDGDIHHKIKNNTKIPIYSLILLAKNKKGYQNLIDLSSTSFKRAYENKTQARKHKNTK